MEMDGRDLSDLFRNTSEEIFLKAVMENSIGVATAPSMEMMGFRNMSQSFREDSEELFNSWLMNGEARILKVSFSTFSLKIEIYHVQRKISYTPKTTH